MALREGITIQAPAKVNLYLHVTGRRDDGFHELDSLVVFAGIGDTLVVEPAPEVALSLDGPFAGALAGAGDDNLVLRALRALAERAGTAYGARMTLTKRLPVASGVGGGSADAAAALRALARLWRLAPGQADLQAIALSLGADLPVCLARRNCFVGGIGEALSPAPALPPAWFLFANPGVALSTPAVFAERVGPFSAPARFTDAPVDARALAILLEARGNDLAGAAMRLAPEISDVLDALGSLEGVLMARLSGSGATCFALFESGADAARAAVELRRRAPDWWIAAAPLLADPGVLPDDA